MKGNRITNGFANCNAYLEDTVSICNKQSNTEFGLVCL